MSIPWLIFCLEDRADIVFTIPCL